MALGMISAGLGIAKGLFGGFGARKRERAARKQAQAAQSKMNQLEAGRQDITNLYQSQAGRITNPYANIGVATQAAEMQAQQTDLSQQEQQENKLCREHKLLKLGGNKKELI